MNITLVKFKNGDLVTFGGVVFKVRQSGLDKNHITLDEVVPMDLPKTSANYRSSVAAMDFKEGFGEFDKKGRLVLTQPNRYTTTPVIFKYDSSPVVFWKLWLRKIGIYV